MSIQSFRLSHREEREVYAQSCPLISHTFENCWVLRGSYPWVSPGLSPGGSLFPAGDHERQDVRDRGCKVWTGYTQGCTGVYIPGMYIGRHTTLGGTPSLHHSRRYTPPPTTRVHTARIHHPGTYSTDTPPGYTGRYTHQGTQGGTHPGGTEALHTRVVQKRYIPGCRNGAHTPGVGTVHIPGCRKGVTYPGVSEGWYLPGWVRGGHIPGWVRGGHIPGVMRGL